MPILTLESRMSNLVPQYCAKTSSITIFGHIETMPICMVTCLRVYGGLQGKQLVNNKTKISEFAPKSFKSNMVHLLLC